MTRWISNQNQIQLCMHCVTLVGNLNQNQNNMTRRMLVYKSTRSSTSVCVCVVAEGNRETVLKFRKVILNVSSFLRNTFARRLWCSFQNFLLIAATTTTTTFWWYWCVWKCKRRTDNNSTRTRDIETHTNKEKCMQSPNKFPYEGV